MLEAGKDNQNIYMIQPLDKTQHWCMQGPILNQVVFFFVLFCISFVTGGAINFFLQ